MDYRLLVKCKKFYGAALEVGDELGKDTRGHIISVSHAVILLTVLLLIPPITTQCAVKG